MPISHVLKIQNIVFAFEEFRCKSL